MGIRRMARQHLFLQLLSQDCCVQPHSLVQRRKLAFTIVQAGQMAAVGSHALPTRLWTWWLALDVNMA